MSAPVRLVEIEQLKPVKHGERDVPLGIACVHISESERDALCRALRIAVEALDRAGGTLAEVKSHNTDAFMSHCRARVADTQRALREIAALVEVEP